MAQILGDPNGRWKSYAVIASAQQDRRLQSQQEGVAALDGLARGRDRLVAMWALDELADSPAPEATQVLQQLAGRPGPRGDAARIRLQVREGR